MDVSKLLLLSQVQNQMILYCAPASPPTPCPQTARAAAEVQAKRVSLAPVLRKIMQNPVSKWEGKRDET
jgi:hypothetical protein